MRTGGAGMRFFIDPNGPGRPKFCGSRNRKRVLAKRQAHIRRSILRSTGEYFRG